jgi:hypothetical protein
MVLTAVVSRGGDRLEPVDNTTLGVVVNLDLVGERGLDTVTAANAGADCGVSGRQPISTVATRWALDGIGTVEGVARGHHCTKQNNDNDMLVSW